MPFMNKMIWFAALLGALLLAPVAAGAQEMSVADMAPFSQRSADGTVSGPAVDLVREAADATGSDVTFTVAGPQGGADLPAYAHVAAGDAGADRSLPFYCDEVGIIGGSSAGGFL